MGFFGDMESAPRREPRPAPQLQAKARARGFAFLKNRAKIKPARN
jgi:hypothetical protein